MGAKVTGEKKLLQELTDRLGGKVAQAAHDRALVAGGKVFVAELRSQMEPWKDTGDSIKEIQVSDPQTVNGKREIKIFWKGPKNRYRIIHLNEFGTITNPSPPGKGAIARAERNAEKAYRAAVKKELKKAYG